MKKMPIGRPFQKGVSGNPSGRKKIPQEFRDIAEKYSVTALQRAIEIMTDPKEDTRNVLRAIEIILDRGIGKPIQALDIDAKTEQTNRIVITGQVEEWAR